MGKSSRGYKYEKLPQSDEGEPLNEKHPKEKRWWGDRRWKERNKSEERDDNKKNELAEKQMELKEKQVKDATGDVIKNTEIDNNCKKDKRYKIKSNEKHA